jgi:hypothetical protein
LTNYVKRITIDFYVNTLVVASPKGLGARVHRNTSVFPSVYKHKSH